MGKGNRFSRFLHKMTGLSDADIDFLEQENGMTMRDKNTLLMQRDDDLLANPETATDEEKEKLAKRIDPMDLASFGMGSMRKIAGPTAQQLKVSAAELVKPVKETYGQIGTVNIPGLGDRSSEAIRKLQEMQGYQKTKGFDARKATEEFYKSPDYLDLKKQFDFGTPAYETAKQDRMARFMERMKEPPKDSIEEAAKKKFQETIEKAKKKE